MKYNELISAHKEKIFQLDKAYIELILPIINKDSWEHLDSILDFVRRWNKRVPIEKNKEKIKKVVLSLRNEFESIKKYNIENFEFNLENINKLKNIFDKLSETVLKSTGTTKLMYAINQNLFVMWDKGICIKYGFYPNSTGYIHFMKLMQEQIKEILKEHNKEKLIEETGRTLPKLIDEYNWINYSTSKMLNN